MSSFEEWGKQIHDLPAERTTVGLALTGCAAELTDLGVTPDHFYHPKHAIIFQAIRDQQAAGIPVDPNTITAALMDAGTLHKVGGASYLHECLESVVLATDGRWYANRLLELAARRRVMLAMTNIASIPQGTDAAEFVLKAERYLKAATPQYQHSQMSRIGHELDLLYADIECRNGVMTGLPTGFAELDTLLGGYQAKRLIIVGGRPGMGKSIFGLDAARRLSVGYEVTSGYWTMEMSRQELTERAIAGQGSIHYQRIRDGKLTPEDWEIADKLKPVFSVAPLFFDDSTGQTVESIAAGARQLKAEHDLRFMVVDHIGLVRPVRRGGTRQEEVAEVARSLKELARELDITVMALAQLHRLDKDRVPELSDLRESGEIEQSADVVIFPYRPDYADPESPRAGEVELWVKKNRAGAQGMVDAAAQLHYQRFVDFAQPPGVSCQ